MSDISTKIFLDSGDPKETRRMLDMMGYVDGQTTNPTLITRHPDAQKKIEAGEKLTQDEFHIFYLDIVREISAVLPKGSVSIEVCADAHTPAEYMLHEARVMNQWISNAHIKLPTTHAGLTAAQAAVREGIRVNMTLCFTQQQAAAVHAATRGAKRGDVFVSPFVGRLDDLGKNGIDLIRNIMRMYEEGHVEVLVASIRTVNHVASALSLAPDIITAPLGIWSEWARERPVGIVSAEDLDLIPYEEINLDCSWEEYDIAHDLTDKGLASFAEDWKTLVEEP